MMSITLASTKRHYLVKVFDKRSHSKSPIFGTLYISDNCRRDPTGEKLLNRSIERLLLLL